MIMWADKTMIRRLIVILLCAPLLLVSLQEKKIIWYIVEHWITMPTFIINVLLFLFDDFLQYLLYDDQFYNTCYMTISSTILVIWRSVLQYLLYDDQFYNTCYMTISFIHRENYRPATSYIMSNWIYLGTWGNRTHNVSGDGNFLIKYIDNIYTLLANIKSSCRSFRNRDKRTSGHR
jgi:hypothetical protein